MGNYIEMHILNIWSNLWFHSLKCRLFRSFDVNIKKKMLRRAEPELTIYIFCLSSLLLKPNEKTQIHSDTNLQTYKLESDHSPYEKVFCFTKEFILAFSLTTSQRSLCNNILLSALNTLWDPSYFKLSYVNPFVM